MLILSERKDATVEVVLRYRREDGTVNILMHEIASGESYQFDVPNNKALDAFNHPYCYMFIPETMAVGYSPIIREYC